MHNRQAPGQEHPAGRGQMIRGHRPGGLVTAADARCGTGGMLRHEAVYYHGPDDYRSAVQDFLRAWPGRR